MRPLALVAAAGLAAGSAVARRRLRGTHLAAAAVLVAALVVHGSGVVQLPDLEQAAKDVGPSLGAWAYLAVGALAFLETAFFVGLVAPGEFAVVLGGFIAGQGVLDVALLAVIVSACAAAGDTTSYLIGRRLGRAFLLRHGPRFGLAEQRLEHVEAFFARHGGKTILVGRFVGLLRALMPFTAGASRVPARRFLPVDYLAAVAWSLTFVTLGYVFWQSFDTVVSVAKQSTFALGVAAALVVAGIVAVRRLERPKA